MIAHRFKMRSDVQSYSLAGQGCAFGIITIELATQLLKVASLTPQSVAAIGELQERFVGAAVYPMHGALCSCVEIWMRMAGFRGKDSAAGPA